MTTDLAALLDRCRRGDDLAWEAFVRQFQRRVYSIACGYTANSEDARDLAQDVFIRLYETRGRWAPADVFTAWLVKVARNVCLDDLRRRKALKRDQGAPAMEADELPDTSRSPEAALAASGTRQMVWQALRSLSHLSREVIMLKDIQGFTFEEIASMLHAPVGTVKSRSSRARLELAERILSLEGTASVGPLA